MLKPTLQVKDVLEVNPRLLSSLGVQAICIDLDDTLVASNKQTIDARYKSWVEELKTANFSILILSNGSIARVRTWSQTLNIKGLSLVGKPLPFAFYRAFKHLGTPPAKTVVIGDQIFTDVLGANLVGAKSILVNPLSPGKRHTRILRKLERQYRRYYTSECPTKQ